MNVVGVDLAWSESGRGRTGLCAVAHGRVTASAVVRSDDEIVDWTEPRLGDPAVVAVDAPLVVANESGQRPCERAVASAFGRYHAGCHPSNLRRFPDGGRAIGLARRLGLEIDPRAALRGATRSCLEVYPHPALVCLFDLPRSLPYKAKRGRPFETRREALLGLLARLEGLNLADPPLDVASAPRWVPIRSEVEHAAGSADLDRVEDEVDAFVCAYVGLFYVAHGRRRARIVGDLSEGYIVVPVGGARGGSPIHEAASRLPGALRAA